MANNSQPPINVGLNLQGNALGSVDQLTKRMIVLRDTAKQVGAMLKVIDTQSKNAGTGKLPTAATLKNLRQQMDLLSTTPDVMAQRYYQNISKANQAAQMNSLVNSNRQFQNPNTMQSILTQYDPKLVKQALNIRKDVADMSGDIKKVKDAEQALIQYKNTLKQLNTELKGLDYLKRQQDQTIQSMMQLPAGTLAMQRSMQARTQNQFATGAREQSVLRYMNDPSKLAPRDRDYTGNVSADQMRKDMQNNASKMAAAQRLMGQLYLQDPQKNPQVSQQLNQYSQVLAKLEEEKTRLQAIQNLRRANLRTTDEQIQKLRQTNDLTRNNQKLQELTTGGLRVKTLSTERIAQLSPDNLIARQITMTKRLAQAKEVMFKAEEMGNAKAKKDAEALAVAYKKELDLIRERQMQLDRQGRPNNMVTRYQEMSTGESSGALLGIQGVLMRNYMLWGAFMGSITGSYAFLRDFEVALKQTQAISQATNTQMEALKNNILEVSENSRFSAIEITEAATALAQAGFSMSEIQKTLESVTLLATATGSTLKETVDIATASLGAFQLSAESMPKIVNQITQAMNLSKLDIQKFQLAVQYAGNAASDAGLNFEELLATVATVANAGVRSGSTLGTGFRQLLTDLVAPSTKFENILTKLGLTAADVDVRTNGLVGSLKRLKEAGFTTADAYESFEVRSVAFYTALSNNLESYDDLTANLDNNTAAMEANEIQMNSLGAQTDRMFNQFKAMIEVAGAGFRDALTDVFHVIGDVAIAIKNISDNGFVRFIVQASTMTAVLTASILVFKSMAGALAGLFGAITTGAITLQATVPIIAAVSAVVTVAVLGFKQFTKTNNDLAVSVERSKTNLNNLKDSASNLQTTIVETDKKIASLESRFESLQDNPAAVAVELVNLQTKAAELGVTLSTDLTNSIESVRKGWEELRNELSKSLVIDLSQQIAEVQDLARNLLNLKVQEIGSKPNMFSEKGSKEGGYGKVTDFATLTAMSDKMPLAAMTDRSAYIRYNSTKNSGNTYNDNLFNAISQANIAGGGKAPPGSVEALMKQVAEAPNALSTMTDAEKDAAIPAMREQYTRARTIINRAKNQFLLKSRDTKISAEQKKEAESMLTTLDNFLNALSERAGVVNSVYGFNNQEKTLNKQVGVENEVINIRSALMSGNVSDLTSKSDFGNALALGRQGKAKDKYDTRNLARLMPEIKNLSKKYGVPEDLIVGHMITESGVRQDVTSPVGAMGLMQVMPDTAKGMDLDVNRVRTDQSYNLEAGVRYLAQMKKNTNGSWEDASRAYFMGAGGLNKYKATNGGSYRKGYNQSTEYAQTVYANMLNFQKTRGGRYSILEELDIPSNTASTMSEIESLNSILDGAKAQINSKGDYAKLSAEDKKQVDTWMNQISASEKLIAEKSASVNNTLRAAQTRDAAERKVAKNEKAVDLQKIANEIVVLEAAVTEAEKKLGKDGNLKKGIKQYDELSKKLSALYVQQIELDSSMKALDSATYDGSSLVINKDIQELSNLAKQGSLDKNSATMLAKRNKAFEDGLKEFNDYIKEKNKDFTTNLDARIADMQEEYTDSQTVLAFNKQKTEWSIEDDLGITELRNRRQGMDDPRVKDQFTDAERSDIDLAISKQSERVKEVLQNYLIADRDTTNQQIDKVQTELDVAIFEFESFKDSQNKLLSENRTGEELKQAQDLQRKEMAKVEKTIQKHRDDLLDLQKKSRDISNELAAASPDNAADRYSFGDTFQSISKATLRQDESAAGYERDIQSTIGGINSAFHNLINTAVEASDNVDDFFKIITGGSGQSREAFKAFGYEIISTMAKVVQNRLVNKFVDMMLGGIFGNASGSSSAALNGQTIGSGTGGSPLWQTALSGMVQAGVGAFTGMFAGGFGGAQAAGVQASGATTYGIGADYFNSGISVQRMANGGEVIGGTPNTDSVPIMSMPGEYYLPKDTTAVVGKQFLTGLKDDPHGMMNALKGNNLGNRPTINKKVESNIYMVAPQAVPSTLGPNDIVVAVSDNISRNGELKQLIKQVQAE